MSEASFVTHDEFKLVRDQVDILQVASAEKRIPWYRQRPSPMSLVALIFSVFTFLLTQHSASLQEIRSKKEELRKLIIEMLAFQENFSSTVKTISDPGAREVASSLLNAKRVI